MFSPHQLEFSRWSQLQVPIDYGRIVQTEHHWIEDFLIYKTTSHLVTCKQKLKRLVM